MKALISHWKLYYILDNFLSCHHCLSSKVNMNLWNSWSVLWKTIGYLLSDLKPSILEIEILLHNWHANSYAQYESEWNIARKIVWKPTEFIAVQTMEGESCLCNYFMAAVALITAILLLFPSISNGFAKAGTESQYSSLIILWRNVIVKVAVSQ